MAEANEKMSYQVIATFTTETEGKTMTKTFSDYNTAVTDDTCREVCAACVTNVAFKDAKNGVITGVKKVQRVEKKITDVPVDAA